MNSRESERISTYFEWNFCAHGPPVSDDGLLVVVLPVPAVKLHAAATSEQDLDEEKEREI